MVADVRRVLFFYCVHIKKNLDNPIDRLILLKNFLLLFPGMDFMKTFHQTISDLHANVGEHHV